MHSSIVEVKEFHLTTRFGAPAFNPKKYFVAFAPGHKTLSISRSRRRCMRSVLLGVMEVYIPRRKLSLST